MLAENVLHHRHVMHKGTHGKTTTTSLLTWILTQAGLNPGYLIGGVAPILRIPRSWKDPFFVIEGDGYDCAFLITIKSCITGPKRCLL